MLKDMQYKAPRYSSWRKHCGYYLRMRDGERYVETRKDLKALGKAIAGTFRDGVPDFGAFMQVVDTFCVDVLVDSTLAPCPVRRILRTPDSQAAFEAYRRDMERFSSGHWQEVGWGDMQWFKESSLRFTHSLHVPREPQHKGMVAFAESEAKFIADRFTVMKPGKYLQRFFGEVLDPKQIKELADTYVGKHMASELKWATTQEEMIRAINMGPSDSCMSAGFHDGRTNWFRGHIHPAAIYAAGDIHVAYIENGNKEVVARVVCNIKDKTAARIYGDERLMQSALEAAGYAQKGGALVGCRLLKIENTSGRGRDWVMAYVDRGTESGGGCLSVRDDGTYWELYEDGSQGNTYGGYEGNGTFDGDVEKSTCPCCGDRVDEEDMEYVECREESICRSCIENEYVWGYTSSRYLREQGYIHQDDAVRCESNREYYHSEVASAHDVHLCEVGDGYYHIDDLVGTYRGLVHVHDAVALDEEDSEGNNFAYPGDAVKTHDGRTIHKDSAVERDGKIYHEDDDIETNEGVKEHA